MSKSKPNYGSVDVTNDVALTEYREASQPSLSSNVTDLSSASFQAVENNTPLIGSSQLNALYQWSPAVTTFDLDSNGVTTQELSGEQFNQRTDTAPAMDNHDNEQGVVQEIPQVNSPNPDITNDVSHDEPELNADQQPEQTRDQNQDMQQTTRVENDGQQPEKAENDPEQDQSIDQGNPFNFSTGIASPGQDPVTKPAPTGKTDKHIHNHGGSSLSLFNRFKGETDKSATSKVAKPITPTIDLQTETSVKQSIDTFVDQMKDVQSLVSDIESAANTGVSAEGSSKALGEKLKDVNKTLEHITTMTGGLDQNQMSSLKGFLETKRLDKFGESLQSANQILSKDTLKNLNLVGDSKVKAIFENTHEHIAKLSESFSNMVSNLTNALGVGR